MPRMWYVFIFVCTSIQCAIPPVTIVTINMFTNRRANKTHFSKCKDVCHNYTLLYDTLHTDHVHQNVCMF